LKKAVEVREASKGSRLSLSSKKIEKGVQKGSGKFQK